LPVDPLSRKRRPFRIFGRTAFLFLGIETNRKAGKQKGAQPVGARLFVKTSDQAIT